MSVELRVNGQTIFVAADAWTPLLRNELGLKGSRYGCGWNSAAPAWC
jgi:aerobic-type carbon monoxide dehydrogenase small subunit (CoxS/CutS family)